MMRVQHPNVAEILRQPDDASKWLYYVMELVRGTDGVPLNRAMLNPLEQPRGRVEMRN